MGEGGGFPQVRVVVSLVSSRLPMGYSSTKGAQHCINQLVVGWMQIRVNE
jgi:hypothetical protein